MTIDYQSLMNEAVLGVVKKALTAIQHKGIIGDHSLYISFLTWPKEVVLSKVIKQKYPKEITIVLQHQFRNLQVFDDKFTVNIAFGGVAENIEVPFAAITNFLDPTANFGCQFIPKITPSVTDNITTAGEPISRKPSVFKAKPKEHNLSIVNRKDVAKQNNVIAIDNFRKKRETENKPS